LGAADLKGNVMTFCILFTALFSAVTGFQLAFAAILFGFGDN
jgi:hypothetical protein